MDKYRAEQIDRILERMKAESYSSIGYQLCELMQEIVADLVKESEDNADGTP